MNEYTVVSKQAFRPSNSAAPSDSQLRDLAVGHLKAAKVSYSVYAVHLAHGDYVPKDGSGTEWGKALGLLAQIGAPTPPPPPPPPVQGGPDANARHLTGSLGIGTDGKQDDFYLSGSLVNITGANTEVSRFDAGPSNDSCIVVEDALGGQSTHGAHIHDGRTHGSGTPRIHTWGDHGIYSCGLTLMERVEAFNHNYGQAFSCRWWNVHYQCHTHDTPFDSAIFDYSDGSNSGKWVPALWREHLSHKITSWAFYMDTPRMSHTQSGTLGPNTIPAEFDHCTFDLRGQAAGAFNLAGDPVDGGSSFTNNIVIWDGAPGAWLRSPRMVNLAGNAVLSSVQAAQYLNADYTPKDVAGSPILGKAVATTGRANHLYGSLPDVGRFQH